MSQVILQTARAGHTAPVRIVMLPAAYAAAGDFVEHGFGHAVRERQLDIDLVFAGFELPHVTDRTVLTRLRQEHILPARAGGASVWLGGISLGGYLALCYAERHGQELGGLCLFSPYLGSHIVTGEIARAQGVRGWHPGELAEDDDERRVWRFIKTRAKRFPIHLGMARADRFADRHAVLAAALPAADVDRVDGGHDWPTWRRLWDNFLDARFAGLAARA